MLTENLALIARTRVGNKCRWLYVRYFHFKFIGLVEDDDSTCLAETKEVRYIRLWIRHCWISWSSISIDSLFCCYSFGVPIFDATALYLSQTGCYSFPFQDKICYKLKTGPTFPLNWIAASSFVVLNICYPAVATEIQVSTEYGKEQ